MQNYCGLFWTVLSKDDVKILNWLYCLISVLNVQLKQYIIFNIYVWNKNSKYCKILNKIIKWKCNLRLSDIRVDDTIGECRSY